MSNRTKLALIVTGVPIAFFNLAVAFTENVGVTLNAMAGCIIAISVIGLLREGDGARPLSQQDRAK